MTDPDLEGDIASELDGTERLLWTGRPEPRRATRSSLPIVVFGIPWTAFSIFWICGASGFRIPDFSRGPLSLFPLFGLPFVLLGLGMLSAPFWAWRLALRTAYAVTDRRVMVIVRGSTRTVRSYGPDDIGTLDRVDRPDGSGDLIFAVERLTNVRQNSSSSLQRAGFYGIPDVRTVQQLILANLKKPRPA